MIDILEEFALQPFIQTKEYLRVRPKLYSVQIYWYLLWQPRRWKTDTANEYTQPQVLQYYNNRYPVSDMVKANMHLCRRAFFTVQV